jgi:hypothetical protein
MSYYEDDLSKWYVSANNKHSTFLNQIKDFGLKNQVDTVMDNRKNDPSFDTRFYYDVPSMDENENVTTIKEQFSIWIDENPLKHKLYRLTPGQDSSTVAAVPSSSSSSSSSGSTDRFKPKGYIDGNSHDCILLEDYKQRKYPTVALSAKDKTPNNFMIFNNGKMEIWIWVGTYVKYGNE